MDKFKIPFSELLFTYARSSGAGGQNVNKVNSKVILHWNIDESPSIPNDVKLRFRSKYSGAITDIGDVVIVCQTSRSQKMNQDECIEKLHAMIEAVARPPKIRKATKPTRSSKVKRLNSKRKDSDKKRLRSNKDY